jgi:hypothetical protein|eukprot:jgi/Chrpa1/379/Chrysochromulina_OHIO_Genome00016066-RA
MSEITACVSQLPQHAPEIAAIQEFGIVFVADQRAVADDGSPQSLEHLIFCALHIDLDDRNTLSR